MLERWYVDSIETLNRCDMVGRNIESSQKGEVNVFDFFEDCWVKVMIFVNGVELQS